MSPPFVLDNWIPILLLILAYKNLPFIRFLRTLITRLIISPINHNHLHPTHLFLPAIHRTRSPVFECDYNIHKSNSTYFTDLDISRGNLSLLLFSQGLSFRPSRHYAVMILSGVQCVFRREIKPYQGYEVWSRVMSWDEKWVYIVSHFVERGVFEVGGRVLQGTSSSSSSSSSYMNTSTSLSGSVKQSERNGTNGKEDTQKKVFASAVSRYVFKQAGRTFSPREMLVKCGLLPKDTEKEGGDGMEEMLKGIEQRRKRDLEAAQLKMGWDAVHNSFDPDSLHDILSARHLTTLADHDVDIDVPTVTVTPTVTPRPLTTEDNYAPGSEPREQDMNGSRGVRKAGRPRLDKAGGAVLSEDRRNQVRRAQRTYRLKKEATLQQIKQRVVDLEKKLDRISSSFADMMQKLDPGVKETSPALVRRLDAIYALLADGLDETSASVSRGRSGCSSRSIDNACSVTQRHDQSQSRSHRADTLVHLASIPTSSHADAHPNSVNTIPPTLLQTPISSSSSHHERTFTHHLHRLSLEHAFHLFSDARSPPLKIYQVFRLVPCIRDKSKMDPYFRRLISASIDEPLELHTLPFYCVGGAGTHYPLFDGSGRPVYPVNRRLPRRVLGGLSVDDGLGAVRGRSHGGKRGGYGGKEEQRRLQAYGLGGVWFDCRDVEGYLKENGVRFDGGLFPEVGSVQTGREGNDSDAAEQLQASLLHSVQTENERNVDEPSSGRGCQRILDIDLFFSMTTSANNPSTAPTSARYVPPTVKRCNALLSPTILGKKNELQPSGASPMRVNGKQIFADAEAMRNVLANVSVIPKPEAEPLIAEMARKPNREVTAGTKDRSAAREDDDFDAVIGVEEIVGGEELVDHLEGRDGGVEGD
ncbi:uncharacterized protein KD926_006895 [Aspergillus affinis]|uniref:uncharacterized protein n=1 Tax=Aspergillus affinis TaxID=1070780 RepID=UPI0022FDCC83|nr:uncharacterized protein KD926_006895 [Aspergillus affinis]KAI9041319.1 hypothetical protein KD926_006895 [Aspergillus affinis]